MKAATRENYLLSSMNLLDMKFNCPKLYTKLMESVQENLKVGKAEAHNNLVYLLISNLK